MAKAKVIIKTDPTLVSAVALTFKPLDKIAVAIETKNTTERDAQRRVADALTDVFTKGPGKGVTDKMVVQQTIREALAKHQGKADPKEVAGPTVSEYWTFVKLARNGHYNTARDIVVDYVKANPKSGGFRVNLLKLANANEADPMMAPIVEETLKRINGDAGVEDAQRIVLTGKGDDKKVVAYDSTRADYEGWVSRMTSLAKAMKGAGFDLSGLEKLKADVEAKLRVLVTPPAPSATAQVTNGVNAPATTAPGVDFEALFAGLDEKQLLEERRAALMAYPAQSVTILAAWKATLAGIRNGAKKPKRK